MEWNKNETWLLTADHTGNVKYWQSNMNNVKSFDAHSEVIRDARYVLKRYKFNLQESPDILIYFVLSCNNRLNLTKNLPIKFFEIKDMHNQVQLDGMDK